VAGLAHEVGQPGALVAGGGGEPGAQGVAGVALRVEPGGLGGSGSASRPSAKKQLATSDAVSRSASQRSSETAGQVRGSAGLA
jgi:hypothetical protein